MSSEHGAAPWWDLDYCTQCYEKVDKYGQCPTCDVEHTSDEEE